VGYKDCGGYEVSVEEIKSLVASIDSYNSVSDKEGELLYNLCRACKEGVIVEIGSWKGRSTIWLGWGAKEGNNKVYAVDPHSGSPTEPGSTYEEFLENIKRAGLEETVVPIRRTSMEALKEWTFPIGILFIDGDHKYEAVVNDFMGWGKFLVEGGSLAIHDTFVLEGPRKCTKLLYECGNFADITLLGSTTYAIKKSGIGPTPYFVRRISELPYRALYSSGRRLPKVVKRLGWRVLEKYPPHSWRYPTKRRAL